jgi:predicted metal-dependent HD superfamily phosphohydrolase
MITLQEMSMLTTLYTQPHRHYHNINHINECLVELEGFYSKDFSFGERKIVERAIWFHDAVYNPYSKENEVQSAMLVPEDPSFVSTCVRALILLTAKHTITQPELGLAAQVMLDIDLAGFGKPWEICKKNGENVRREYYNTSERDFYVGRLKFLQTIGQRESLYYTDFFREKYHVQSQKNLTLDVQYTTEILDQWSGA